MKCNKCGIIMSPEEVDEILTDLKNGYLIVLKIYNKFTQIYTLA